jgi:hypothetical protein
MSLSWSLLGSSRSNANAFVTPRYASRSSTANHHRGAVVGLPKRCEVSQIKITGDWL